MTNFLLCSKFPKVQTQLHVWDRAWCHFVVWTLKDMVVVKVERQPGFADVLSLVENYYFQQFVPYLLSDRRKARKAEFTRVDTENRKRKCKVSADAEHRAKLAEGKAVVNVEENISDEEEFFCRSNLQKVARGRARTGKEKIARNVTTNAGSVRGGSAMSNRGLEDQNVVRTRRHSSAKLAANESQKNVAGKFLR